MLGSSNRLLITEADAVQFLKEGFVTKRDTVSQNLLGELRAATERVIQKTLIGEWPHRRNWPYYAFKGKNDFWGVSHLLHPDLGEPIFAEYLAETSVASAVKVLLEHGFGRTVERIQLELVNLLNNPLLSDFEIPWHRDNIRFDVEAHHEVKLLSEPDHSIRWNFALYPDNCFKIVPQSHLRAKTEKERQVYKSKAFVQLEGELTIALQPGDFVFYNVNLLHRGVYPKAVKRRTLHCCMGEAVYTPARAELFHDLKWMTQSRMDGLPQEVREYYDNFILAFEHFKSNHDAKKW